MSKYKQDIIRLRKQGKSYNEIKEKLGCSKGTISYHCKRKNLGDKRVISDKKKEKIIEYRKTHTSTETSEKFDVSRSFVEKYAEEKYEKEKIGGTKRKCKFCGREFIYKRKKGHRKNCCNGCNTKIRRTRNKLRAIKYLGGECSKCGYDKHISALEFHHVGEKSITIGQVANKSWEDIVKPELEECVILCSNCHRAKHSNRFSNQFVEKVVESGRLNKELASVV